jgi:hypothetical protein
MCLVVWNSKKDSLNPTYWGSNGSNKLQINTFQLPNKYSKPISRYLKIEYTINEVKFTMFYSKIYYTRH